MSKTEQPHVAGTATTGGDALPPAGNPPARGRRLRRAELWALAGTVFTALGVLVAVLAWWFPQATSEGTGTTPRRPGATASGTAPAAAPDNGRGALAVYLDTQAPQAGREHLRQLPRALAGRPGYDRPVVVACPTNQGGDFSREVNYPLRGRYLTFEATVRASFTAHADAKATVTAVAVRRERDGTSTSRQVGWWQDSGAAAGGGLAASVEGADALIVRVECEEPDGLAVLTEARVTPAGT